MCPTLGPGLRARGEAILGEVVHHLMEDGLLVFGQEVAEGDTLIVGTHLHVESVVRVVVPREVQRSGTVVVAHGRALTIGIVPQSIHLRGETHRIGHEPMHPALGLLQ